MRRTNEAQGGVVPTMRRRRLIGTGMVKAFGLALVLVGLPIVLWHQGLGPHSIATSSFLRHPARLLDRLPALSVGSILAVIAATLAWCVWVYLVACSVIVVIIELTGRVAFRLPGARLLRLLVVGTAAAVVALVGSRARSGAVMRLNPVAVAAPGPDEVSSSSGVPPGGRPSAETYRVQPGDTLWSIAEGQLGSPLRWREIASANVGIPQDDGGSLREDNWVRPGWMLRLPIRAAIRPATGLEPPAVEVTELSPLGAEAAPGSPSGSPARIDAADVLPGAEAPIEAIGYGLLGGAAVTLLDRMRRAQTRRRPHGHRISLPGGRLRDLERDLRASDRHAWDVARDLVAILCDQGDVRAVRSLEVMRIGPQGCRFRTDPDVVLPPPFEPDHAVGDWFVASDALAHHPSTGVSGPARQDDVALVTIGADSDGMLALNLIGGRSLAIVGSGASALVAGITAELATTGWASGRRLIVVGHRGDLGAFVGVEQLPSSHAALATVRSIARDRPTVVICPPGCISSEPTSVFELLETASEGRLALVLGVDAGEDPPSTRWRVTSNGESVTLERADDGQYVPSVDTQLALPARHEALLDEVHELVVEATDDSGVALPEGELAVRHPGDRRSDEWEVMVRLLGPVDVRGLARPFARAWSLELAAFLATRPRGATTDMWAAALWPDRLMAAASLHSTASDLRRALGPSASGEDHLPKGGHGRLRLGPGVTSDWDQFQKLAANDDPLSRHQALQLVRGRPLDGLRSSDWGLLDGVIALMESLIVDVAVRHAEDCLERKNLREAEWSARQALLVSPYDERLYRVLMRAADADGHPAGVENALNELITLVGESVSPFDGLHPETIRLYESLSRHRTASDR